jgi:phage-related holin
VTCGATRSAIAFLHGDLVTAFRWNPLAFVAFCALMVFDLYAAIVLVGRTTRLRSVAWTRIEKNVMRIVMIGVLALNWIYLLSHHDRF